MWSRPSAFDSGYVITAELQVHLQPGQPVRSLLAWPAGLGDMEEFQGRSTIPGLSRTPSMFAWSVAGKQDTEASSKVSNANTLDGDYQYAATADLYFAAAFLPDAFRSAPPLSRFTTPSICLPTSPTPAAIRSRRT